MKHHHLVVLGLPLALLGCPSAAIPGAETASSSRSSSSSSSSSSGAVSSSMGGASSGSVSSSSAASSSQATSASSTETSSSLGTSSSVGGSSSGCQLGAACTLGGGALGFLDDTCTCVACTENATGDAWCATAYGHGQLCIAGSCVAGNCRTVGNCGTGQLCTQNQCSSCTSTADCTATGVGYGSGFVCSRMGLCVRGDCVTSADCTGPSDGKVCSTTNTCAACGSDNDCLNDAFHAGMTPSPHTICSAGRCVSNACTASGSAASVTFCPAGTMDNVCCGATTSSTEGTCIPNTKLDPLAMPAPTRCCGTGQANCAAGQECANNFCSACSPVPTSGAGALTYFVDPATGNDSGTGFNSAGCQFKTLARALSFVGQPGTPVTLVLLGDISVQTGETFNHLIPANVKIMGGAVNTTGATAVVTPTPRVMNLEARAERKVGLRFQGSNSGASYLDIQGGQDGTNRMQALMGIWVVGNGLTGVELHHLNLTNLYLAGILVGEDNNNGAQLSDGDATIGPAVRVQHVGDSIGVSSGGFGVAVVGLAHAMIIGNNNGEHVQIQDCNAGIAVSRAAGITLNGDATSGTVELKNNRAVGLGIFPSPGDTRRRTSSITGLLVTGTSAGSGIAVGGGTRLRLRNSRSLSAVENGLVVYPADLGAGGTLEERVSMAGIDLGTAVTGAEAGGNEFQAPLSATAGNARNLGVGICVAVPPALTSVGAQVLNALGNKAVSTTSTTVNCTTGATITARRDCTTPVNGIPVSVGIAGGGALNRNSVNVQACSLGFAP